MESTTVPNQIPNQAAMTPARGGNEVVSAGEMLSVKITIPKMPVVNWKCTNASIYVYSPPVTVSEFNGKKYLWCKHYEKSFKPEGDEIIIALPKLTIVHFYYGTGTHRHTGHRYNARFVVQQNSEVEFEIKDEVGKTDIILKVQNLVLLETLLSTGYNEDLAEMQIKGYAASKSKEEVNVYAYRIMKLAQKSIIPATASSIDKAIEELQKIIEQKKQELAELEKQLEELIKQKSLSGRIVSVVKQ
jgi:hypothetical protein